MFLVTQAVLPGMRAAKWGRIINLSSVAAQTGGVIGPHYAASKAGILGLTHSYAALLAKEGITVNAIAPALIETEMKWPPRAVCRLSRARRVLPSRLPKDRTFLSSHSDDAGGRNVPVGGKNRNNPNHHRTPRSSNKALPWSARPSCRPGLGPSSRPCGDHHGIVLGLLGPGGSPRR